MGTKNYIATYSYSIVLNFKWLYSLVLSSITILSKINKLNKVDIYIWLVTITETKFIKLVIQMIVVSCGFWLTVARVHWPIRLALGLVWD